MRKRGYMSHSETVPVIDIAPYLTGGEDDKYAVARALAAACTDSGFFCITGHGIDENLIARTRHAGAEFFARPLDQKQQILRDADRTGRGYYPVADRALAKTLGVDTPPDLQEAWDWSKHDWPISHPSFWENVWPKQAIFRCRYTATREGHSTPSTNTL